MRLGVVGNCQMRGLADCLAALRPGDEVVLVHLNAMVRPEDRTPEILERHAAALSDCDAVFSQYVVPDFGPLGTEALTARARRLVVMPSIAFDGLHPDCIYVRRTDGTEISAAMGPYHSALAFACFAAGIPAARAVRLFNLHSHAALGYLDAHAAALAAMEAHWTALGFDLGKALAEAGPAFMHTINHPRIDLLQALARQALDRVGIAAAPDAGPPEDRLASSVVWPIYPEIARRLGVEGSLDFRPHPSISLDLRQVIEASYAAFAGGQQVRSSPPIVRAYDFVRQEVLGLPPHPLAAPARAEDVQAAYRMILGRNGPPPEEASRMAESGILVGDLRRGLLKSEEFRKLLAALG